jgi:TetR/AcrR family transcriptional regulator, regulator of cefoperazone and chloramphenicol sensitivity
MAMPTLNTTPESASDKAARARIRDVAIEQFGQHGFDVEVAAITEAAGMNEALLIHEFGSIEGLRKACDDYILESIRTAKSESLQSMSPATWFAQLAQIESYAPMMNYLVRSMLSGGDLGRALMGQMIDNAEGYLEDAVRAGTIKPSRDPKARAAFLAMSGGGGFLLYLHMHDNPTDMEAVLRDYGKDMIMPALELYTHGLLTDTSMYDAFVTREEAREGQAAE